MSIDIGNIKDQIKTILDAANTTTASPVDLSNGMDDRIQNVYKVNPERMPLQSSKWPCICMYVDNKGIEFQTIAKNQSTGKRLGTVNLKIIGAIYNTRFSDISSDESDNDIEYLMENIEEIIRANSTLNDAALYTRPTDVQYYAQITDDQAHIRTAELSLDVIVNY